MFKNRSLQLNLVKKPSSTQEPDQPAVDPEKIEEIARKSAIDLAKLTVATIGSLMVLRTTLNIIEDKATSDD